MASIRKVGKRWRVEVRKYGLRESRYFDSKARAKAWGDMVEARGRVDKPLRQALERYAEEVSVNKKGERWERVRLALLSKYPLADKSIALIDPADVAQWRDHRLKEVSGSSVRRELNLLSAVFQKAIREWQWCDHNPVREIDRPKECKPRDRRVSEQEIERILLALGYEGEVKTKQQEVAVLFLLAIETAMRLGEMVALKKVYLDRRYVVVEDSKNGHAREVPLSTKAVSLLQQVPDGFTVSSESASTFFRRACKNAEVDGLRFHDSRREALTRLSQKVDVMELARISGHRDLRVLLNTYYRPDISDLASKLG